MSVVALVYEPDQARSVIPWAARFAVAQSTELIIFYWADPNAAGEDVLFADGEEDVANPTLHAAREAIETVVRTRQARAGRIARHLVSLRRISDPDPKVATIRRIRAEDPQLVVAADRIAKKESNGRSPLRSLLAQVPCDKLVLYGNGKRSVKTTELVVGTSEGSNDKAAVALAASALAATKGTLTVFGVEAPVGDEAIEVGERSLRTMLRELELEESRRLQVKVVLGDSLIEAIAEEADGQDLLLVGADNEAFVPQLLELTKKPTIGVVYRAPQFRIWHGRDRTHTLLPHLNPADYADLYEMLQTGSRWNTDFMLMLVMAASIATLGLIQSSPAVVIGSMLLAPLMTPMIGMGLALNQGNAKLARTCFRSIGFGFLAALGVSFVIGVITPGSDPTPEVLARTEPNILDLLIALFSGIAAAYALARPGLVGTVAGVAIATALVPPLCSAGISLAYHNILHALGALSLLAANVVAIMLAAALTFRLMGLAASREKGHSRPWVRRVVFVLGVVALVMAMPLVSAFFQQIHRGKSQPMAFPVTNEVKEAIRDHVESVPGRMVLLIGRPGIVSEKRPIDVGIIIASDKPLPRSFADELTAIVRDKMEDPEARVRVACVAENWAADDQQP